MTKASDNNAIAALRTTLLNLISHPLAAETACNREMIMGFFLGGLIRNHCATIVPFARIRTRKLPNPALIGNAGSFFKNPVVTRAQGAALREANPGMPAWDGVDGQIKLSAAWLIESCGFKGLQQGHAAVSEQHALVLVNRGQASGSEIWALAESIRDAVASRFGVDLEAEPLVL